MLIVSRFDIELNFDNENNRNIFQETDVFFADDENDDIVYDENNHRILRKSEYFLMSIFRILSLILVKENNEMKISILPIKYDYVEYILLKENQW
jgi:hypothetical protein